MCSGLWLSRLLFYTTSGWSSTELRLMKSLPLLWSSGDHHQQSLIVIGNYFGVTVHFLWRFPLDYLSDSIYVMDILIHFRTGMLNQKLLMLLIVQVKYVMLKSILTKMSWFGQRNRIREDKYQFLRDSVSSTFSISIDLLSAYLEDGVLQTDSVKLRQHYMNSTTFYIDLLCLLPLDFLYLSLEFQSMLRVCRLVKIYRFWEFLDRCSFYLLVAIFSP